MNKDAKAYVIGSTIFGGFLGVIYGLGVKHGIDIATRSLEKQVASQQ